MVFRKLSNLRLRNVGGWLFALAAIALAVAGCKREARNFDVPPSSAQLTRDLRVSDLQPGSFTTNQPMKNGYEENAFAMSEGKRLYTQFNCVGCHAHGGGGMGPPLMDDKWIYGSNPEQVYATIIQGRPNGMPSFGGKIPDYAVWQLAAYVRSMSGLASKLAATGRDDHMQASNPENSVSTEKPKNSTTQEPGTTPK
jgi:cytochrome c oxidase cbb3-type subunit 3